MYNLTIADPSINTVIIPPNDPGILTINSHITRNISRSVCGGNGGGIYMAVYGIRFA